jgi:HTH-type transcriptional regulator/antitoxin HigA
MKTKTRTLRFVDLPADYTGLCRLLVPRPIHDRAHYANALEILEAMAGYEEEFTPDQADYFSVIADFVSTYEAAQQDGGDSNPLPPLDALKYLLAENHLTAADLSRLLGTDRTLGAKILRGERNLTVPHLRILADRFQVSPALFI